MRILTLALALALILASAAHAQGAADLQDIEKQLNGLGIASSACRI